MTVAAFVFSAISLVITVPLGIFTFIYARRDFKNTGPRVDVRSVSGNLLASGAPFIQVNESKESKRSGFVTRMLDGAKVPPGARERPVFGLYVFNRGRTPVTLRNVALETRIKVKVADPAELDAEYPPVAENVGFTYFGQFLAGSELPRRLDPFDADLYLISELDFCQLGGELTARFYAVFDDGRSCAGEYFTVTDEHQAAAREAVSQASGRGDEMETVDASRPFGIIHQFTLPPGKHSSTINIPNLNRLTAKKNESGDSGP